MPSALTRRQLLQASGGFTLLAILPDGTVQAAPHTPAAPQPVFKALPYLQPGPNGSRLRDGNESIVLAWETTRVLARFEVECGRDGQWNAPPLTARTERYNADGEDGICGAARIASGVPSRGTRRSPSPEEAATPFETPAARCATSCRTG